MPDRVATELRRYINVCQRHGAQKDEWLDRVEHIRARIARFVGAEPHEVAFTKNTSDGLNIIGHSLGLKPTDNILVSAEHEHGNNVYPWLHLRRLGVEVREIPRDSGGLSASRIAEAIDDRTRLVTISWVSFSTGVRVDLESAARACHDRGVFLLVDAAQGLGILRLDVQHSQVDAVTAPTQKGLLGIYGLGIMVCRGEWISRLEPTFLSRTGVDLGARHESDIGSLDHYQLKASAARFELGNPNFAALFALDAGVSLLEEVGRNQIEGHVVDLAAQYAAGLRRLGLPVATPREGHGGIVSFIHPDAVRFAAVLRSEGIIVSARRGLVRASFHLYNTADDVARILDAIRRQRQAGGATERRGAVVPTRAIPDFDNDGTHAS